MVADSNIRPDQMVASIQGVGGSFAFDLIIREFDFAVYKDRTFENR